MLPALPRVAALVLLATLLTAGCSAGASDDRGGAGGPGGPGGSDGAGGPGRSSTSTEDDPYVITDADFAAVRRLLDKRARAIVDGDRRRFLSTLDPGNARLRRTQLVMFDNLQGLPIDELYYGTTTTGLPPLEVEDGERLLRPRVFEHVELSLVLSRPLSNEVTMTFVERDGRWLLGADTPDQATGSQSRPWYGGPIRGARNDQLLVLTDVGSEVGPQELLDKATAALDEVSDVLDLPGEQPLLVDATGNGTPVTVNQSSEEAGAVTQALYATSRDGTDVTGRVGTLVKANPDNVEQLVEDTATLRHELTHVVLDGYGITNPLWATEGIAEYVGAYPRLLADSYTDNDALLRSIERRPVELTEAADWGGDPQLDYLSAEAFTEYLVTRYGVERYLEMMDTFRRLSKKRGVVLGQGLYDVVLRRVYGIDADTVARGGIDLLEGLDR